MPAFASGNSKGRARVRRCDKARLSNRASGQKFRGTGNREVAVVGILRSFARLGRSLLRGRARSDPHCTTAKLRITRFEQMEERKPLTANPFPDIHLGAVYLEPAGGNDASPNVIQVTFKGG